MDPPAKKLKLDKEEEEEDNEEQFEELAKIRDELRRLCREGKEDEVVEMLRTSLGNAAAATTGGPGFKDGSGATVLHAACARGLAVAVREILETEEARRLLLERDSEGKTPLMAAAIQKHTFASRAEYTAVVELILATAEGAETISVADNEGSVPLHRAWTRWVVGAILGTEAGRNTLHAKNKSGETPLHNVLDASGHESVLGPMLEDVESHRWYLTLRCRHNGHLPLHTAAEMGDHGAIERILQFEEGMKALTEFGGQSPLELACANAPDGRAVRALLKTERGRELLSEEICSTGNTLLHEAAANNMDCALAILEHADGRRCILWRNYDGDTPLHRMCRSKGADAVFASLFLDTEENRSALTWTNKFVQTPRDVALDSGNLALFELLDPAKWGVSKQGTPASEKDLKAGFGCTICLYKFSTTEESSKPMIVCDRGHTFCQWCSGNIAKCPNCRWNSYEEPVVCRALLATIEASEKEEEEEKHLHFARTRDDLRKALKDGDQAEALRILGTDLGRAAVASTKGPAFKDDQGSTVLHSAVEDMAPRPEMDAAEWRAHKDSLEFPAVEAILNTEGGRRMILEGDAKGRTPLHKASVSGYAKAVGRMLGTPEGIQALCLKDELERTPLHLASSGGVVRAILATEAGQRTLYVKDYNSNSGDDKINYGLTPFHHAIRLNYDETMQAILENAERHEFLKIRGGCYGETPLHEAAKFDRLGCVKMILETKAGRETLALTTEEGDTPLHTACREGSDGDVVRAMLAVEEGRRMLGVCNDDGSTPLDGALYGSEDNEDGNMEGVKAILEIPEGRRDALAKGSNSGNTLLHILCDDADTPLPMVKRFLETDEGRAALAIRNNDGKTPVELARSEGNADMAELLAAAAGKEEAESSVVPQRRPATDEEMDAGLACPVCIVKFSATGESAAATVICANGHTFCLGCTDRLKVCPVCREAKLERPLACAALSAAIEAFAQKGNK